MPDREAGGSRNAGGDLERSVSQKVARKLKARAERDLTIWFGLGSFGVVGWSVAIPMIAGVAFGLWLDSRFPSRISWSLTFLLVGLFVGLTIAWNWIDREGRPR